LDEQVALNDYWHDAFDEGDFVSLYGQESLDEFIATSFTAYLTDTTAIFIQAKSSPELAQTLLTLARSIAPQGENYTFMFESKEDGMVIYKVPLSRPVEIDGQIYMFPDFEAKYDREFIPNNLN